MKAYGAPTPRAAVVREPALVGAGVGGDTETDSLQAVVKAALAPRPESPGLMPALDVEIAAIKKMVGQVLQCSRHTALRVAPTETGGLPGGDHVGQDRKSAHRSLEGDGR